MIGVAMHDCPFCPENNGIEILYRDEYCYIAPTNDPVLENSLMIISVRHVATPFDFSADEWASIHAMLLAAKRILDEDMPDGYSIGWNVNECAGQFVPHAHLHVIGRYRDEPMAGQGIRYAIKQPANARPSKSAQLNR
jgi:diadenosine tetraphosphate (Ap4A) HIT family hydrolase